MPGPNQHLERSFGTTAPISQALPAFLRETEYKDPTDELHTAWQKAWRTPLPVFSWFANHPEHLAPFNDYMALRRPSDVTWLSVYPVEAEAAGRDILKPLYVEVGGGIGHQCAEFKDRHPTLPGRVILQDLPQTIEKALPTPGVENMAIDFFQEQPVKGTSQFVKSSATM